MLPFRSVASVARRSDSRSTVSIARAAVTNGLALLALLFGVLSLAGCGDDGSTEGEARPVVDEAPELRSVDGYGYVPRACGFDLDDDGVVGEPEDCRVCDGATADPDGDGVDEDIHYVDCDAGQDTRECGAAGLPCATLSYVLDQLVDGPQDGAEDIVCFAGTCRDTGLAFRRGGLDGSVEVPATGLQERPFRRGRDPAMLVGWDRDGDGEYPPVDTDDVARIEPGGDKLEQKGPGIERAFTLDAAADRVELAHFEVHGFGRRSQARSSGLVAFGPSQGTLEEVFLHDLHLIDLNRRRAAGSEVSTFNLFAGKTRVRWLWAQNLWSPRTGGWFARGSGPDEGPDRGNDVGPLRFEGITATAEGCDFSTCDNAAAFTAFHFWGRLSEIEILGNHFDAATSAWEPKPRGGPAGALFALVAQCSQDWTLRGNLVEDFKSAVRVQGWTERYCDDASARPVTGITIDQNLVRNTYAPWGAGDVAVLIEEGGEDPGEVVGDVRITHNIFASPVGAESCFWLIGGNGAETPPGEILFQGNTCFLDVDHHGALVVGYGGGRQRAFPHERIRIVDNIVSGLGVDDDPNLRVTVAPTGLEIDGNVYDPAGSFVWIEDELATLEEWQNATGLDGASIECLPEFEDLDDGDYSLAEPDEGEVGCRPAREADETTEPAGSTEQAGATEPAESAASAE